VVLKIPSKLKLSAAQKSAAAAMGGTQTQVAFIISIIRVKLWVAFCPTRHQRHIIISDLRAQKIEKQKGT